MAQEIPLDVKALLNVVRFPNGPIHATNLGDKYFSQEAVDGALQTIFDHYTHLGISIRGTEMQSWELQAATLATSVLGLGSILYNHSIGR